jgi:thioredoxin-like negative regulator of GroEL
MAMLKIVLGLASALLPSEARLGTGIVDLTASNFDDFMRSNDKVMVDFVNGPGEQTEELLQALRELRGNYDTRVPIARVCATKDPDLAKRFVPWSCDEDGQQCQHSFPQLLWFVHGEATRYHRRLEKANHIVNFVLAMNRDLVTTISDESEISKWNRLILFKGERRSPTYKALERLASEHMDTLAVAHLEAPGEHNVSWIAENVTTEIFEDSATKAESFGVTGAFSEPVGTPPIMADHRTWGTSVWPERNADALEKWVRTHLVWSEELPKQAIEGGSVVVVGKTFEKLVLRKDSDVFFLVYAPWCGYSRKILPIWAEFAHKVAGTEGLTVAKMDGTQNIVSTLDFTWTKYPTILYFRAGETKPVEFTGNRTVEDLVAFANEHSSTGNIIGGPEGLVLLQKRASYRTAGVDL